MLGFYRPNEGQIQLDGKDIRYLAANELRQNFGVVPQETVLFSGSLYDNLIMVHPHASFEEVIQACKAAEIHEVIEQLPEGYQTINRLKGKVTMIFITHQVPKGLQVDEVVNMGQHAMSMHVASTAS